MHIADQKYLEHIDSSLIRRPKSMIIVDGVTYNGERHLVTYPKISHKTERAIGSFPAKTCEFEIYNPNGTIDLHGKEIAVYRGLIFDEIGTGGWIKVGTFSATDENIKTNINKKTISFKGTDRTLLLDKPYGGRAQWDESMNIGDIVREICTRTGVPLGATLIPLSGYTFSEIPPGLDFDNTTDRQLIAYIAELGGCNARINNDGELIFCGPDSPRTGRTISKEKYKNLSVENSFGPINTISFGHRDYEDAYLYRQEGVTDETMVEWAINDNPLTSIVDKEGLARIASPKFFGRTFVPFEVEDLIDDYIFELNDNITIEKKDGTTVDVTILEMETTSRIKSKFGAAVQTPGKTDTALAGGIREQIKKVEFKVDHQEAKISSLIQDTNGMKTTIEQTAGEIKSQASAIQALDGKVTEVQSTVTQTAGKVESVVERVETIEGAGYTDANAVKTIITQEADNITMAVSEKLKIGANNILLDSACFENMPFTDTGNYRFYSTVVTVGEDSSLPSGKYKSFKMCASSDHVLMGITFKEDVIGESYNNITKIVADKIYTLSFWAKVSDTENLPKFLYEDAVDTGYANNEDLLSRSSLELGIDWKKYIFTFKTKATQNPSKFVLDFLTSSVLEKEEFTLSISSLKLEEGSAATEWTPNPDDIYVKTETYNTQLKLTSDAIAQSVERISVIENAGYINEETARGMIETSADEIKLAVTKEIKVGARNRLRDSACFESKSAIPVNCTTVSDIVGVNRSLPSGKQRNISFTPTTEGELSGIKFSRKILIEANVGTIPNIILTSGRTYTLSFWARGFLNGAQANPLKKIDLSNLIWAYDTGSSNTNRVEIETNSDMYLSSTFKKFTVTFHLTKYEVGEFDLRFLIDGLTTSDTYELIISSLKLEEGNIATDWTPNPEDIENKLVNEYVKTETYNSDLSLTNEKITGAVERIQTIEGAGYITETTARSMIETSADNITLAVTKSINVGARNILLDSACFESITIKGQNDKGAGYNLDTSNLMENVIEDKSCPSGKKKLVGAFPSNNTSTNVGVRYKDLGILGETGTISKIQKNKEYTLSFWLCSPNLPSNQEQSRELLKNIINIGDATTTGVTGTIRVGDGEPVSISDNTAIYVTKQLQKYTVTFTVTGEITRFWLSFVFKRTDVDKAAGYMVQFYISSLKLEEGNIATDWSPHFEDINRSVEAKLDLCVKTDEDGNLLSAIHAQANQITIETDNFTLDDAGNMTCNNATIKGGKVEMGDTEGPRIEVFGGTLSQFWLVSSSGSATLTTTKIFEMTVGADNYIGNFEIEDINQTQTLTSDIFEVFNLYGGLTLKNATNNTKMVQFTPTGNALFTGDIRISGQADKVRMLIGHRYIDFSAIGYTNDYRDVILSAGGLYISANKKGTEDETQGNYLYLDGRNVVCIPPLYLRGITLPTGTAKRWLAVDKDGKVFSVAE